MAFLSFHQISKAYPGVQALSEVSFSVAEGSCHALMGENGAGKSTLGKILAGIDVADGGAIHLRGEQIAPQNPAEARALGIAMVHQELAFCPELTIAENLCLGSWPHRRGWVDRDALRDKARRLLADVGFDEDVDRLVGELTTGQEQLLQIAAALGTGARILVFDEPTSSLSAVESERLFELLADLKRRGFTVVYVSHRMEEIFRLCDTITVLRDGRHVATEPAADSHQDRLVQQMVGRSVERRVAGWHAARAQGVRRVPDLRAAPCRGARAPHSPGPRAARTDRRDVPVRLARQRRWPVRAPALR